MARLAAVPVSGDEEWYEAAGLMVEAMWHASGLSQGFRDGVTECHFGGMVCRV